MAERHSSAAKFFFTDQGSGSPLVFIHGFPLDGRMWNAQSTAFSKSHRVIVSDLPGFGGSTSSGPFTIDSLADDLRAFLAGIDALPCVLAGLSMGGYIALSLALRFPEALRGLILIDTRAEADSPEGKVNRGKMIELARASGSKAIADQMFPKLVALAMPERFPRVAAELREIMEACPAQTIEHAVAAMRDRPDRTSQLSGITCPTLIIVGEQDAITPPAAARSMHTAIAGSVLEIVPDAGHMSPMEQPDLVNQAITRWHEGKE